MGPTTLQTAAQRHIVTRHEPMDISNDDHPIPLLAAANPNSNPHYLPPPPYKAGSNSDSDENADSGFDSEGNNGETDDDGDVNDDDDDDDEDDHDDNDDHDNRTDRSPSRSPRQGPIKLTINAANHVQGSHNLLPVSPTPLIDATRLAAVLVAALNKFGAAPTDADAAATAAANAAPSRSNNRELNLTINCGITVVGDRNVIGHVGLRPKVPVPALGAAAAAATTGQPPIPTATTTTMTNGTTAEGAIAAPGATRTYAAPVRRIDEVMLADANGVKRKAEDVMDTTPEPPMKKPAGDRGGLT